MNKKIIFSIVLVVVAVGFFGLGLVYSNSKNVSNNQMPTAFNLDMRNGQRPNLAIRGGVGGGGLVGEIISKDETSITIKLIDGGSKIILVSDATEITKSEKGILEDLKEGTNIFVGGEESSEGLYTAKTIQIRDNFIVN